jgi:molecular chaperone GrpE
MAFGKNKQTETKTEPEDSEAQDVPTAEIVEEEDPLLTLTREKDEAVDRWMRLQADFQNHRRHAQANIEAAVASARSEVLGEAVTILDYLDMALAFEVTSEEAKNLKVGVEMTRQQLQGLLDRMNVKAISAEGAFDPSRHQAVSTVETDEHEPGTIMEVVRGGWTMGEAVLRFAQVRVAAAPDTKDGEEDASEESAAVDGDPAPAADSDASHDEGASESTEEEAT